jgi:hypothetical protein
VAADFFTVEMRIRRRLQRFLVLFFIELSTRKVEIAGIAAATNGLWMGQIGRNLTDAVEGILNGKRYLIHDRDPLFTAVFLNLLAAVGVKSVKLPPRSPNLNAYAERFVRSIKETCLERMILFGEDSLRRAVHEFVAHYHHERNHQGLAKRLISPEAGHLAKAGVVAAPAPGRYAELLLPCRRLNLSLQPWLPSDNGIRTSVNANRSCIESFQSENHTPAHSLVRAVFPDRVQPLVEGLKIVFRTFTGLLFRR